MVMDVRAHGEGFEVILPDGSILIRHTPEQPCIGIGVGRADFTMHRGNFSISESPVKAIPLSSHSVETDRGTGARISFGQGEGADAILTLEVTKQSISIECGNPEVNRFWIKLAATKDEAIWGCGEQFSYLNLRGRNYPLWSSEPGVGRDKSTELTQLMDEEGSAGGDYWMTGYPQPTFLSSRGYALHADSTAYADFDFSDDDVHTLSFWEVPRKLELYTGASPADLVSQLAARFGPQSPLPDWALEGAVIGLKDGPNSFERLENIEAAGTKVTGLWCEDWIGMRETSFGSRLMWDWRANEQRYPGLKDQIAALKDRSIHFLGYINPYLAIDGELAKEAMDGDHVIRNASTGEADVTDFGEFDCVTVDLTRAESCDWFAERIIGKEMIELGLSGWMADFGEYLPTDVLLHDGSDPEVTHNKWPVLWAQVNDQAVRKAGRQDQIVFFMRSGASGLPKHCPLLWAGDQSVDFSRHDGIGTAITAALSAGLVGNGHSHSDIGGYTSLHGRVRSRELMMRWSEMAVFTPFMRTHEGNRPKDNLQIDSDAAILDHFAAMTRLHFALAPYSKAASAQVLSDGLPMQRAMFLHYGSERETHDIQDQYLYGRDLLVAPILAENSTDRDVFIPANDNWYDLWTNQAADSGWKNCSGPLGFPPVYVRAESEFESVFASAAKAHLEWGGIGNG